MKKKHGKRFTCDTNFDNEKGKVFHRNSHSYTAKFRETEYKQDKWNKYRFTFSNTEKMEVHIGKGFNQTNTKSKCLDYSNQKI